MSSNLTAVDTFSTRTKLNYFYFFRNPREFESHNVAILFKTVCQSPLLLGQAVLRCFAKLQIYTLIKVSIRTQQSQSWCISDTRHTSQATSWVEWEVIEHLCHCPRQGKLSVRQTQNKVWVVHRAYHTLERSSREIRSKNAGLVEPCIHRRWWYWMGDWPSKYEKLGTRSRRVDGLIPNSLVTKAWESDSFVPCVSCWQPFLFFVVSSIFVGLSD